MLENDEVALKSWHYIIWSAVLKFLFDSLHIFIFLGAADF